MDAELLIVMLGALAIVLVGVWRYYAVARFIVRVIRGKK